MILGRTQNSSHQNSDLLLAMKTAQPGIAPRRRDYWSGVLGFNLSHSLGLILFALLVAVTNQCDMEWLKPALIFVGIADAAISHRCWSPVPTTDICLSTGLLAAGWWP
jgi:hypothetical protein